MPPTRTDAFPLPLSPGNGMESLHGATPDKKDEAMVLLSPLDAMMHKLGVVLLYIFPRPSSSAAFDLNKLQTSFITLVNEDYPILIGELHIDQDTGVVSVKQTPESSQRGAQGIRFETNATSLTTAEEAMATLSWELMPTPRGPTELICVKATVLSDGGLVVGVDTSHTLLDGEGMFTFMTAWGQHYSGVDQKDRLVINHDRHLLAGTGSPSTLAHPEFQLVESEPAADAGDATAGPAAPMPPPTSQHRFHFTPGMMKRIKNAASQGASATGTSDPSYVSTIDAITALFTALISRARGHGQDVQVTTAINARRRLNPPLPDNYAGNVVFSALSSYKSAELQADSNNESFISELSLAKLAQRVRGSIRRSDNEYLRDAINFMTEQSNLSAVQPATNFVFGPDIMYTSWVRTGMYDAEFEGTRPLFVSVPPLPLDGFVIITEAARNSPGVDVLVFLESIAMEKLKELFAHVAYLQDEHMLLSTL
ncbi:hypothetical protein KRP22_011526 [Phytophthora ramorum]|nr:Agmatine coumaroyltransferase-1 [Phytophthora ramorum]